MGALLYYTLIGFRVGGQQQRRGGMVQASV
jgi:hypothetical protein